VSENCNSNFIRCSGDFVVSGYTQSLRVDHTAVTGGSKVKRKNLVVASGGLTLHKMPLESFQRLSNRNMHTDLPYISSFHSDISKA
jgi:hypothetical protein